MKINYKIPRIIIKNYYIFRENKKQLQNEIKDNKNPFQNKILTASLGLVLSISETLPFLEKCKSNGVLHAFRNAFDIISK